MQEVTIDLDRTRTLSFSLYTQVLFQRARGKKWGEYTSDDAEDIAALVWACLQTTETDESLSVDDVARLMDKPCIARFSDALDELVHDPLETCEAPGPSPDLTSDSPTESSGA